MHTNLAAVSLFILTAIYPLRLGDNSLGDNRPAFSDQMREEVLYDTVGTLLFTDEQKADLYARLAEQLTKDTPRAEALKIIQRAIHACQYPG